MSEQKDEELRQTALKLRTENRKTIRDIAEELGIASGKVAGWLKGVPATGAEEPIAEKRQPQFMPMLISKEHVAKLYALAMDEGFEEVNDWIKTLLLPWYSVKRDFEWKLRMTVIPHEFAAFIETAMTDSIELKQLKEKLRAMGSPLGGNVETSTPVSPTPSITVPVQPNKGVKPT
jgi:transcriptional regulator with XRE-family HTH domain